MRARLGLGAAVLALGAAPATLPAAEDAGGAAFHFLNLGTGPRLEALGGVGTALGEGADGFGHNPARVSGTAAFEASASWFRWLADVRAGHLSAVAPVGRGVVAGLEVRSLSLDEFSNVSSQSPVDQSDLAVTAGAAFPLVERLHGGVGLKLVTSSIAGEEARGWAVDAGLDYRWVEGWNVAAALRNLGPAFAYGDARDEQLPTRASLGVGATLAELRLGAEGSWENGPGFSGGLGAEYEFRDRLLLRAGSRLDSDSDGAVEPWSVGVGFRARPGLVLDYSFRDGTLEASHRVGVHWAPGRSPETGRARTARSPREFWNSVLEKVIDSSLADFPRDAGDTVIVRASAPHSSAKLVAGAVASRLVERGIAAETRDPVPVIPEGDEQAARAVAEAGLADTGGHPLLEVEIRESAYEIVTSRRERRVGPRSVERQARVDLGLSLIDAGAGAPRWTSSGTGTETERVAAARIRESSGWPQARGPGVAGGGGMHPLVEPAIVSGIVAGLAVIFFANRDVGN